MRAWRSDPGARTASSLCAPRGILLLATFLLLIAGALAARPARAADSTRDESGFRVRVVEQSKGARAARPPVPTPPVPGTPDTDTLATPIPPEPPDFDSGENDLVRFGEDIEIPADKVVDGNVVAMGGDVTVYGRVRGDVVSIGGGIEVRGNGAIEGDAVSVGGGVETSDSASVRGSNVSVGPTRFGRDWGIFPMIGFFGAMGFGAWLFSTVVKLLLTLFFAWLALVLWKDGILRSAEHLRERFGKSFLWGLIVMAGLIVALPAGIVSIILLSVIAIVILCITIIGIPLALLLVVAMVLAIAGLVFAVIVAIFLGHLNGVFYLGRRVLGTRAETTSPLMAMAVGLALLAVLALAGKLAGFVGFVLFHPLSIAFGIAAGALSFILTAAGLGALWFTIFESGGIGVGVRTYNWGRLRPRAGAPAGAAPERAGEGVASGPAGAETGPAAKPPEPPPGGPSTAPRPEGGTSDAP